MSRRIGKVAFGAVLWYSMLYEDTDGVNKGFELSV